MYLRFGIQKQQRLVHLQWQPWPPTYWPGRCRTSWTNCHTLRQCAIQPHQRWYNLHLAHTANKLMILWLFQENINTYQVPINRSCSIDIQPCQTLGKIRKCKDFKHFKGYSCCCLPAPNTTAEYACSPPAGTKLSTNSMSRMECVQIRRELGAEDLP